jgi:hypothetical protein
MTLKSIKRKGKGGELMPMRHQPCYYFCAQVSKRPVIAVELLNLDLVQG